MRLTYGNYAHADHEVAYTILSNVLENEAGQPFSTRTQWNIQGQLQAADTASLIVQMRLLEAAYSTWYRDLTFFDDNGNICHKLWNAGSTTGVKITSFGYPNGSGAQLSTFRDYSIAASADYPATGALNLLKSFRETLSFAGGGPERVIVEIQNGLPQEQFLKLRTTVRVTQSGQAVGMFGYPIVPPPIFPGKERIVSFPQGSPQYGSPQLRNGVYVDWPVSWNYEFVSAIPLAGLPNRWPAA